MIVTPNRFIGRTAAAVVLAFFWSAMPAAAQEETTDDDDEEAREELDEIVVTGSHIRGVALDGLLPVHVMSSDDIAGIAPDSGGELLESMAQADISHYTDVDTVDRASIQSARGDVRALNLRGLGSSRTLVLLNGRRLIQHPGTQFNGNVITTTVNTNSLPSRGIQRVEVLADGASALYGTDAVAGVVNTVLMRRFEGLTLATTYGGTQNEPLDRRTFQLYGGQDFNEGRTNISLSLNHYVQDGYLASELDYAASEDLRPLFEGTPFEGDLQLDNRATFHPWGYFGTLDGSIVRDSGGTRITGTGGGFHIQPAAQTGCRASINSDICVDDGLPSRNLRFDANSSRNLRADVERSNAFVFVNHAFDSGLEFFGELGAYRGELSRQLEAGWFAPSTTFTVSKDAYWNPFGRMFLDNGELNPNRLPGIDAPEEGLDIEIARYRPIDWGYRRYTVVNHSYRVLGGLRGDWNEWSWESALLYSWADTLDRTNGISNTAFFEALNREDETAYNPFNGFCLDDLNGLNGVDCTPSNAQTLEDITVSAYRKNETTLALADFRLSRNDLWRLPGGYVGLAVGAEYRHHGFVEDRDPRMDGTITYTDTINDFFSESDLFGMSATPDFDGSRNVYSVFSELLIPVVGSNMDVPLVSSLDVQLAARFEDYSDVGSVLKPKVALGWHVFEGFQIRGSYTEGFTAPPLELVNAPEIIRSFNGIEDNYRCQAGVNKGIYEDARCELDYGVLTPYVGNKDIKPEENESYAFGFSWRPFFADNVVLTVNRWVIEQHDIFGGLSVQDTVELDWAMRMSGLGGYELVERAPVTQADIDFYAGSGLEPAGELRTISRQFLNLEKRTTKGVDIGLNYRIGDVRLFGVDLGRFRLKVSGAYLETAYQDFTPALELIRSVNEELDSGIVVTAAGELRQRNRRPRWRATGNLNWSRDAWRAGVYFRYSSEVFDTSLELNGEEELYNTFTVGTKINVYGQYTFREGFLEGLTARLGARNVTDKKPPLVDSTFGYPGWMTGPEGRYVYGRLIYRF